MRKPDIFDEIIACLAESKSASPDTSMDQETLQAFYSPAKPRPKRVAAAPAAPQPAFASQKQPKSKPVALSDDNEAYSIVDQSSPAQDQKFGQDPRINADMDTLRKLAMNCRTCRLCETRTNVVFEDGNRSARLMFIGEGPGADEDVQGIPFVGRAGQLLTRMIQSMGFDRSRDVYIANIVKCRPPQNRNPQDDEAGPCMPFLYRQIELVNPDVIVLLGAVPLQFLMGIRGIGKVRGQWLDYKGIKVMATFHPAYLLRNPPAKADAWADLKKVMAFFGHQPDPRYR